MCGIAGLLLSDPSAQAPADLLGAMLQSLRHRGPDDEGGRVDGPLAMGMRRLSVIDLATGHQPIRNEDDSVWVVCNGEIYNFPELRRTLEARQHRFATHSDTEVIVHLYEDFGDDFVDHLAGMFAIALWDARRRRLVLARDRLGIKPLYYYDGPERIVFGSEVKALLTAGIDREIDLQALHDYLSFNYVPGPRSIFRHVRKLPPGHLLVCEGGRTMLRRYWRLPQPTASSTLSEAELVGELRTLLGKTVAEHLASDVPLGVFLSGGVDSGSLVALASEASPTRLRTFSIGFEDPSYDELATARRVAERFGTEHHELVIRPDAVRLVPELARFFDEPFADSSAIPVYYVARLAREHVKVALSGEGGDEVFGGYETYAAYHMAQAYKRLPRILSQDWIPRLVQALPVSDRRVSFDYRAKRFVEGALLPPADGHYHWKVIFAEGAKERLYARGVNGFADPCRLYRDAWDHSHANDPLLRLQQVDQAVYLPDDILVKADRMTMANSLEGRVPFLDHRVVEFAAKLPANLRVRGIRTKVLLKRAMRASLPAEVIGGRKRGFNVPIPIWLRGQLRDFVNDVLHPRRVRDAGFFDPRAVRDLIQDHAERRHDRSRNIWGLLMFELWREEYAEQPQRAAQADEVSLR
jgi:asparagine synthase (glutamine-hydrolysing)